MPKGELLFRGGKVKVQDSVKIKNKSGLENELQDMLYPEPNSRFLGLYPGLHYYLKAQHKIDQGKKPNFILRWLNKKIGEEPAYFSDVKLEDTKNLLENRLENSGFFYGKITQEIKKDTTKKTAETNYTVVIGKPYHLNNYTLVLDSVNEVDSFPVDIEIHRSLSETILKKGVRYDLGAFKAERKRIDQYLKDKGYYNFNSSFILFQADTNLNKNRTFNLYLKLKPEVPLKSKVPYVIDRVDIFPNITKDTTGNNQDTVTINEVNFIQNNVFFKPKRLRPFVLIKPEKRYNPKESRYTSQRISSIGTYKFVNIKYKEVSPPGKDSLWQRHLNATISLSPLTKRSIRAEVKAVTKSNDFTGPNLSITYLNRNVFKAGVNFTAAGNIGYEKQFGKKTNGSSSLQMGLNTALIYPRLLFPGNLDKYFKYSIPKSKISLGFDYYRRSKLYSLNSYSASFGYIWKANPFVTHQLDPIKINYVKLGKRTPRFDSILDSNPYLKRSFEQQFIAGLNYTFVYDELNNERNKGNFYVKFNFDIAGNTINIFGKRKGSDSTKSFLGLSYAQYVKGDLDLSYHYDIGHSGNVLIGRIFGGIGIPYGNSQTMPYVKQYFSGGSYSVRAFQIRGLGPGVYIPDDDNDLYLDRSGDIRLEANFEYRFPIFSVIKGALFADAGNIWNLNDNVKGGKFTSDFIHQLGIGTGLGLRIDVQGFVIRFDLAAPLKTPTTEWTFDYKNPVFNFAIGYPF